MFPFAKVLTLPEHEHYGDAHRVSLRQVPTIQSRLKAQLATGILPSTCQCAGSLPAVHACTSSKLGNIDQTIHPQGFAAGQAQRTGGLRPLRCAADLLMQTRRAVPLTSRLVLVCRQVEPIKLPEYAGYSGRDDHTVLGPNEVGVPYHMYAVYSQCCASYACYCQCHT